MPRFFPSNALLLALFACATTVAEGGELPDSLRTASELYRTGRFDAAREEAISFQRYFPDDVDALILLGRIDFEAGRYSDSRQWFRAASAKAPRHPIIRRYRKLLEELEYRNGAFDSSLLPSRSPIKARRPGASRKPGLGRSSRHLQKTSGSRRSNRSSAGIHSGSRRLQPLWAFLGAVRRATSMKTPAGTR